jgi:AcrR family transcriptional regulator
MLRKQPRPTLLRQRALNAAEQLVAQSGASSLTLDAVAQTAGMSKGGLLYHFPSKDALLEAMIERHLNEVESGATTLATRVFELLDVPQGEQTIAASLLAASATNPRLMERCRAQYARLIQSLEKVPCGFEQAMLLLLAVDGLLLGETMQLSSFTPSQRQRIVAALIDRARDCDARR